MDATQARLGSTSAVGSERAPTPPNLRHRWAQQGRQDSPHVEGGNGGDRAQPRFAVCTSPAPCCVVWGACTGGATREVGVPSRVAAAAAPPRLGGLSDPPRDHGAGGHALRTLPPLVILAAYVLYIHTDAGRGRTARHPPPPRAPGVAVAPSLPPLPRSVDRKEREEGHAAVPAGSARRVARTGKRFVSPPVSPLPLMLHPLTPP